MSHGNESVGEHMDPSLPGGAGTLQQTLERASKAKKVGKGKRQRREEDITNNDDAANAAAAGLEAMQHGAYGPAGEETDQPLPAIGQVAEWNAQQRNLEAQADFTAPPSVGGMVEANVPAPPTPNVALEGVRVEQPKRGRGRPRRPLDPYFDLRQNVINGQPVEGTNQFRVPEAHMQRVIDFVSPVSKKRKRADDEQGKLNSEEPISDSELPTAGPFLKPEVKDIEAAVEEYRAARDYTQFAVNDLIHQRTRDHRPDIRALWDGIYERFVLPTGKLRRTRVAIQRTTRRRFHNFESRGKWTPEEDAQLKACYDANPQKWVHIGKQLGRMPEDCRDRWRNYLACGDTRKQEDWTAKEEQELTRAVEETKDAIRTELQRQAREERIAFREQDVDSRINFNSVSEKMHKTRSRLQCYQHWRIMQARTGDAPYPTADDDNMTKMMKRMRKNRAEIKYSKMNTREKVHILQQVLDTPATQEKDIPWKQLVENDSGKKYTAKDRKTAFRKMKAEAEIAGTIVPGMQLDMIVGALIKQAQASVPDAEMAAATVGAPEVAPMKRGRKPKKKVEVEDASAIDPRLEAEAYGEHPEGDVEAGADEA